MKAPVHPAARYPLHVRWSDEDEAYLGSIPGLIGDCCHADTAEGVLSQLKEIAEDLVDHLQAEGKKLPAPEAPSGEVASDGAFSGRLHQEPDNPFRAPHIQ